MLKAKKSLVLVVNQKLQQYTGASVSGLNREKDQFHNVKSN